MPYPLTTVTILLTGEAFRGFQRCRECNWHKATYSASMSDLQVFPWSFFWMSHDYHICLAAFKGHLSYPILELPQNTDVLTRYQAMEWETIQTVAYEAPLVRDLQFFLHRVSLLRFSDHFVGSFRHQPHFFQK